MKQIRYKQFIEGYIFCLPFNIPIYTEDIVSNLSGHFNIEVSHAKTLVNVNLPRIAENTNLVRFQKGIYYRAQNTPFGKTKLNPALINRDRYTHKGGVVTGYETGASFLNQIGLTTQIPKYKKYATNAFNQFGVKENKKLMAIIQKPRTHITEDNYLYLQILDAIANKDKVTFDVPQPEKVILEYINSRKLDYVKLVGYAGKYYNKKTQLRISEIAVVGSL